LLATWRGRSTRAGDERGFTLVELIVALALIAIVAVGFMVSIGLGFRTVAVARQREVASELASARLEHMRSIPFEQVALSTPISHSANTNSPDYYVSANGLSYDVNGDAAGGSEELIVDTTFGDVLHLEDPISVGSTVMEIYQYATWVDDPAIAGTHNYRRLTVVIRYKAPAANGVNKLERSSTLFTPGTVTIGAASTTTTTSGATTTTTAPAATTTTTAPAVTTTTVPAGPCAGDTTGPTGSFSIGPSGSAEDGFTATQNVSLVLAVTDTCAPIVANFSNDGVTWGGDVTYSAASPQVSWSLTAGNGLKTVYGRVRDGVGNTTTLASHTVILDASAPTAPGNVLKTVSCQGSNRTVTMSWIASSDAEGNLRGYRVYRSTNNAAWTELTPQPAGTSKSDTHSKSLNSVRYYVVAYDKAGNVSATAPNPVISLAKNQCS
jgi:prepilin-type N-terminal cleavage/methylation domain-containing protein